MTDEVAQKNPVRLLLTLLVVGIGAYLLFGGVRSLTDNKSPLVTPNKTVITIETVGTDEDRQLGLSGRVSIDGDEGMLFVFDESIIDNCFWMQDMQFAIDMIWMDSDKNVVTVTENVGPDTYPESFCPTAEAKYGLEIGTGRASELGITQGETLKF